MKRHITDDGGYNVERIKEIELAHYVLDIFENINYVGFHEVKAGQKKIDLYFIHQNYPRTVAVELKVEKWKSALRQAYQNSFYAQKTYVGLWYKCINDNVLNTASSLNIGVIKISESEAEIILDSKSKYYGFTTSTQKILENLTENRHDFIWKGDEF